MNNRTINAAKLKFLLEIKTEITTAVLPKDYKGIDYWKHSQLSTLIAPINNDSSAEAVDHAFDGVSLSLETLYSSDNWKDKNKDYASIESTALERLSEQVKKVKQIHNGNNLLPDFSPMPVQSMRVTDLFPPMNTLDTDSSTPLDNPLDHNRKSTAVIYSSPSPQPYQPWSYYPNNNYPSYSHMGNDNNNHYADCCYQTSYELSQAKQEIVQLGSQIAQLTYQVSQLTYRLSLVWGGGKPFDPNNGSPAPSANNAPFESPDIKRFDNAGKAINLNPATTLPKPDNKTTKAASLNPITNPALAHPDPMPAATAVSVALPIFDEDKTKAFQAFISEKPVHVSNAMKMLEQGGVNVNVLNTDGNSFLRMLVVNNEDCKWDKEIKTLLEKYGADIELKNERGYTPLEDSMNRGDFKDVVKLVRWGANPNATDVTKTPLLHRLVLNNSPCKDRYGKITGYENDWAIKELLKVCDHVLRVDKFDENKHKCHGTIYLHRNEDGLAASWFDYEKNKFLAHPILEGKNSELLLELEQELQKGIDNKNPHFSGIASACGYNLLNSDAKAKTNLDLEDADGKTTLQCCLKGGLKNSGHAAELLHNAMLLIELGADPNDLLHLLLRNNRYGYENKGCYDSEIETLLKNKKIDIKHTINGYTPLEQLLNSGSKILSHQDIARAMTLIRMGANPNVKRAKDRCDSAGCGNSLVHSVVAQNVKGRHAGAMVELKAHGADFNLRDEYGNTPLQDLMRIDLKDERGTKATDLVCIYGADATDQLDFNGDSLLHRLVLCNSDGQHTENIRRLVGKFPIDFKNKRGLTALQSYMAQPGYFRFEYALDLIKLGASPFQKDARGKSILHTLADYVRGERSQDDTTKGLIALSLLEEALEGNHRVSDELKNALQGNAYAKKIINNHSYDFLRKAIRHRNAEMVQLLIDNGADITKVSANINPITKEPEKNSTLLQLALLSSSPTVVKVLCENGADAEHAVSSGNNLLPSLDAVSGEKREILKKYQVAKAIKSSDQTTIDQKLLDLLERLTKPSSGPSLHFKSTRQVTKEDINAIQTLIKAGASLIAKKDSKTPLQLACQSTYWEKIVTAMLDAMSERMKEGNPCNFSVDDMQLVYGKAMEKGRKGSQVVYDTIIKNETFRNAAVLPSLVVQPLNPVYPGPKTDSKTEGAAFPLMSAAAKEAYEYLKGLQKEIARRNDNAYKINNFNLGKTTLKPSEQETKDAWQVWDPWANGLNGDWVLGTPQHVQKIWEILRTEIPHNGNADSVVIKIFDKVHRELQQTEPHSENRVMRALRWVTGIEMDALRTDSTKEFYKQQLSQMNTLKEKWEPQKTPVNQPIPTPFSIGQEKVVNASIMPISPQDRGPQITRVATLTPVEKKRDTSFINQAFNFIKPRANTKNGSNQPQAQSATHAEDEAFNMAMDELGIFERMHKFFQPKQQKVAKKAEKTPVLENAYRQ